MCFLILSPSLKHLQSSMPEPGGGETVVGQSTGCLPEGALGGRMFILTTAPHPEGPGHWQGHMQKGRLLCRTESSREKCGR